MVDAPSSSVMLQSWPSETRSPEGASRRMLAMSSTVLRNWRLIAHDQVVALLADQNLADGLAADGGFDRVLNVADVDAEAIGGGAIDDQVHVRLAADPEDAEVGDAGNLAHDALNLVGLLLRASSDRVPKILTASSPLTPLTASSMLSEIGCEKFQSTPGNLLQLLVHGGDQFVFVAVELGAPLFARAQIDKEFGVVEAAGVGAVVGTADLADDLLDFGKVGEHERALAWPCRCSAVGPVLGASVPRTQIAPSSRCGRNSEPMIPLEREEEHHGQSASSPMPSVNFRWSKHQSSVRRVACGSAIRAPDCATP